MSPNHARPRGHLSTLSPVEQHTPANHKREVNFMIYSPKSANNDHRQRENMAEQIFCTKHEG